MFRCTPKKLHYGAIFQPTIHKTWQECFNTILYIPHLNTAAFLVSSWRILSFEDIVRESDFQGGRTIFLDRSCTPNDLSDDDEDFFFVEVEASSAGGGGGIGADLFCCRLLVFGVISASIVFAT